MSSPAVMHPSKFPTVDIRVQLHCCRDKIVFQINQGNHTLEANSDEGCFLFPRERSLRLSAGGVCKSAQFCSTAASMLFLLNV